MVLKFHAAFLPVTLAANHDERGEETDCFEIPAKFFSVPNLPVLGFEGFTASGLGINFDKALAASRFGCVGHRRIPFLKDLAMQTECTTKLSVQSRQEEMPKC
jgi:hypothetical protein